MISDFVHLNVHTCFSLLEGASSVGDIVERAAAHGYRQLAVTDTNGLYGAVPFMRKAKAFGIRPILGAEIVHGGKRAVCLARNRRGYASLCRMITERKLREKFSLADSLVRNQDGLFILSHCSDLLASLVAKVEPGSLFREVRRLGESDSFLSKSPIANQHSTIVNRLPCVATNNVHFTSPGRHDIHRLLTAVRMNKLLSEVRPSEVVSAEAWLKSPGEMARRFGRDAEGRRAMINSRRIAEACEVEIESKTPIFPEFFAVEDMRRRFAGETPYSALCRLAFRGARRRYRPISPDVVKRLEYELDVIHRLGFAEYFLIVWDIVTFALRKEIPVVGRGSAANSLVAYCLGITSVDPIRYKLTFERFLNLSRSDCPDIDLDLCWRRRDEVIHYIYNRYGDGCAAMVCNHNTYQARSAFRDAARVMGLPIGEINRLSSRLPRFAVSGIRDALERFPESRDFPAEEEPYRGILACAEAIDGFPRHLSIHAGGIVIGKGPLTSYVPLERAAKGIVITQYEKNAIEAIGLVKIDLLGHRTLSVVRDTLETLERTRGVRIVAEKIPDGDVRTAAVLRAGRTIGCFQIESPGMRSLLRMLRAENRLDVIHALSLIRPGPSASGMKERFVRRRVGEEPTAYADPRLAPVLAETFGVMLFQEDILKVAEAVAGFTLEEGDLLRKAISKDRSPKRIATLRPRFVLGAVRHGVRRGAAEDIWDLIANFAGYSYCKAHAVTYGHIAYRAAWLKAHYPAEFLAAVMSNRAGFYAPGEYLEEARRWGVRILPPDVNRSAIRHTGAKGVLRVGLAQVKGLARRTLKNIVRARAVRPFACLEDFHDRTEASASETENLILCDAMGCFGETRPQLMWRLRLLRCTGAAVRRRASDGDMFGDRSAGDAWRGRRPPVVPILAEYPVERRIALEQRILGLAISGHPIRMFQEALSKQAVVASNDLSRYVGKRVTVAGWLIAARRAVTKNGEYMKFLTIEDCHGTMEVTLFPKIYRRFGHRVAGGGGCLVRGRVESDRGVLGITAEWVGTVDASLPYVLS